MVNPQWGINQKLCSQCNTFKAKNSFAPNSDICMECSIANHSRNRDAFVELKKQCAQCHQSKPYDEFEGISDTCKKCSVVTGFGRDYRASDYGRGVGILQKQCVQCHQSKPYDEFEGVSDTCRWCSHYSTNVGRDYRASDYGRGVGILKKQCVQCHQSKPYDEFEGISDTCKMCSVVTGFDPYRSKSRETGGEWIFILIVIGILLLL